MKYLLTTAVMIAAVLAFAIPAYAQNSTAQQQQQQTTVTTTTTTQHLWHPHDWVWRHGFQNPYGLFQGSNVVTVPAITLAQSVVNTCPHPGNPVLGIPPDPADATVQLSTGQCLTPNQAIFEIQTGQIQIGGQVQAYGNVIVGTPTVLGIQGYSDPFVFFHEHHHDHDLGASVTVTTP